MNELLMEAENVLHELFKVISENNILGDTLPKQQFIYGNDTYNFIPK